MTEPNGVVYVVVSGWFEKRLLGVYVTPERAVGAHDGLWMEGKLPDEQGRRVWVNQRAATWNADPNAPQLVIECLVVR
jgi:Uma2 family endonuclease